jgi:branched-chain amino acid transport system permease protein
VGAVVFNYLKTGAVGFTTYWQGLLGLILVVLVLALPSGIVGTLTQVTALVRKRLSR